ncbi:unnamed protein product, partial [Symbiodinium sp. KB8]
AVQGSWKISRAERHGSDSESSGSEAGRPKRRRSSVATQAKAAATWVGDSVTSIVVTHSAARPAWARLAGLAVRGQNRSISTACAERGLVTVLAEQHSQPAQQVGTLTLSDRRAVMAHKPLKGVLPWADGGGAGMLTAAKVAPDTCPADASQQAVHLRTLQVIMLGSPRTLQGAAAFWGELHCAEIVARLRELQESHSASSLVGPTPALWAHAEHTGTDMQSQAQGAIGRLDKLLTLAGLEGGISALTSRSSWEDAGAPPASPRQPGNAENLQGVVGHVSRQTLKRALMRGREGLFGRALDHALERLGVAACSGTGGPLSFCVDCFAAGRDATVHCSCPGRRHLVLAATRHFADRDGPFPDDAHAQSLALLASQVPPEPNPAWAGEELYTAWSTEVRRQLSLASLTCLERPPLRSEASEEAFAATLRRVWPHALPPTWAGVGDVSAQQAAFSRLLGAVQEEVCTEHALTPPVEHIPVPQPLDLMVSRDAMREAAVAVVELGKRDLVCPADSGSMLALSAGFEGGPTKGMRPVLDSMARRCVGQLEVEDEGEGGRVHPRVAQGMATGWNSTPLVVGQTPHAEDYSDACMPSTAQP